MILFFLFLHTFKLLLSIILVLFCKNTVFVHRSLLIIYKYIYLEDKQREHEAPAWESMVINLRQA